jgi:hypothetical protein
LTFCGHAENVWTQINLTVDMEPELIGGVRVEGDEVLTRRSPV